MNAGQMLEISFHGHSIPQHRLLMSYLRWHYDDYCRDTLPSFEIYRREKCLEWGWVEKYKIRVKGGEEAERIYPKSIAFDKCNREEFNSFSRLASERIGDETGVTLEDYAKAKREFVDNQPGAKHE